MTIAHARPRTDPEDPMEIPLAPMIAWYRVDASRRIAIFLGIGAAAMSIGMFAVIGLVLGSGLESLALGLAGILLVAGGGAATVLGTARVLGEESYVALRTDGILFVRAGARRFVRWDRVEDVRHDAVMDALVIVRDGDPWVIGERFAGIANLELAKKIVEVRRKVVFGLVPVPA